MEIVNKKPDEGAPRPSRIVLSHPTIAVVRVFRAALSEDLLSSEVSKFIQYLIHKNATDPHDL